MTQKMRKLIASRDGMKYGTRRLKAGDTFDATPAHARLLTSIKRAEYVNPVRDPVTLPPIPDALKTRALAGNFRSQPKVAETATSDDLTALRDEYQTKIGRRPYMGWDAATLRGKIARVAPIDE